MERKSRRRRKNKRLEWYNKNRRERKTFGGNPFACRAALTVIAEIERRSLLEHVQAMETTLRSLLEALVQRHPARLAGVRGWGLLQGLVLVDGGPPAPDLVRAAMAERLLLVPAGPSVVRIIPPLIVRPRQLRKLVKRLERALESLA